MDYLQSKLWMLNMNTGQWRDLQTSVLGWSDMKWILLIYTVTYILYKAWTWGESKGTLASWQNITTSKTMKEMQVAKKTLQWRDINTTAPWQAHMVLWVVESLSPQNKRTNGNIFIKSQLSNIGFFELFEKSKEKKFFDFFFSKLPSNILWSGINVTWTF